MALRFLAADSLCTTPSHIASPLDLYKYKYSSCFRTVIFAHSHSTGHDSVTFPESSLAPKTRTLDAKGFSFFAAFAGLSAQLLTPNTSECSAARTVNNPRKTRISDEAVTAADFDGLVSVAQRAADVSDERGASTRVAQRERRPSDRVASLNFGY